MTLVTKTGSLPEKDSKESERGEPAELLHSRRYRPQDKTGQKELVLPSYRAWKKIQKTNYRQLLEKEQLPQLEVENLGFSLHQLFTRGIASHSALVKIDKVAQLHKDVETKNSIYDPRLGSITANDRCKNEHCGLVGEYCHRHMGYIELAQKMINPHFIKTAVKIINLLCGNCGGLKISQEQVKKYNLTQFPPLKRIDLMINKLGLDKVPNCLSPDVAHEGDIECMKFVTPLYSIKGKDIATTDIMKTERYIQNNKIKKKKEIPAELEEVIDLLENISDRDAQLLGFDVASGNHPRNMVMEYLLVPAPSDRTNNIINGRIKNDTFGEQYNSIIKLNNNLKKLIQEDGDPSERRTLTKKLTESINSLFLSIKTNGNFTNDYVSYLKTKKGFIRSNLNAFRVNQSARSVISQNPRLKYYQVGVPEIIARRLTRPEEVTLDNIDYLTSLLREGEVKSIIPSRKSIYSRSRGTVINVNSTMRNTYVPSVGDVFNRSLQNGDYVLLNRQPTLHRYGIMGHEVVRRSGKSIQIPVCSVTPYNADFDGDEMNIHSVQTKEAQEEVNSLVSIRNCLFNEQENKLNITVNYMHIQNIADMTRDTPQFENQEPIQSFYRPDQSLVEEIWDASEDTLDITYLRSFLDRLWEGYPYLSNLQSYVESNHPESTPEEISDLTEVILTKNDLFSALVEYAKAGVLTGKMLFSLALPPNFNYTRGEVKIINGILVSGVVTKDLVGASHGSIADRLYHNHNREAYEYFLELTIKMLDIWNNREGFSFGYEDCLVRNQKSKELIHKKLVRLKTQLGELEYKKTGNAEFDAKIEERMGNLLANMNSTAQEAALKEPRSDPFVRSFQSKAKGNVINLARIKFGGIPYFLQGVMVKPSIPGTRGDKRTSFYQFMGKRDLIDYGVIENSLSEGMNLREMLINAEASREGTLKGVLKTSVGGSLFRRLRIYLQNIKTFSDGSVRDPQGHIIQTTYNYSGLSPRKTVLLSERGKKRKFFMDLDQTVRNINAKYGY